MGVKKSTAKSKNMSIASLGGESGIVVLGHKTGVGDTEASTGNCINSVPDTVVQTERISGAGLHTVPGSGRDSYDRNDGSGGEMVKRSGILKINSAS